MLTKSQLIAQINYGDLEISILGGTSDPGKLITNSLFYIFSAAGILLLIYLVSSGFQYMTSGGDPKQMAMAKGKITNSIVGLLIVLFAYWIVQLVGEILGIDAVGNIFN